MRHYLLLLVSLAFVSGATAQTKATLSTTNLTVTTGSMSRTALVDSQSAVIVSGTFATNTTAGIGTSTTPTKGTVIKITLDSLKAYKNLFISLTGNARVKVMASANDTTYRQVFYKIMSSGGRPKNWYTVPLQQAPGISYKYFTIEFPYVYPGLFVHEIAISK